MLINLDGLVLFGPGSEWFWTMAQFAALTITGVAIFRQLKAQAWANQFELLRQFGNDFSDERMTRTKLTALIDLSRGARHLTPAMDDTGNFFENVANARFHGHMHPRYAREEFATAGQWYWAVFEPVLPDLRRADPTLWQAWERWLVEVRELDRHSGKIADPRLERVAASIPEAIDYFIARLRTEQEMKSGVIPVWPGPAIATETPASEAPLPPVRSA
jgi:hypothetical protein